MTTRLRRALFLLVAGAVAGWAIFAAMVWQATTVEQRSRDDAVRAFEEVLSRLGRTQPIVVMDGEGRPQRVLDVPRDAIGPVAVLSVLAYHVGTERLVTAEMPFWFVRLKGPAARFALRGTGFDLDRVGLAPAELERYGPGLVLDERRANGDRVLVWTE
jgi:hypothetical protein